MNLTQVLFVEDLILAEIGMLSPGHGDQLAAIAGGDKTVAAEALRLAQPEMQRAETKGVIHLNTVSRKLSRLSARVKGMQSASCAWVSSSKLMFTTAFALSCYHGGQAPFTYVWRFGDTHCCASPFSFA